MVELYAYYTYVRSGRLLANLPPYGGRSGRGDSHIHRRQNAQKITIARGRTVRTAKLNPARRSSPLTLPVRMLKYSRKINAALVSWNALSSRTWLVNSSMS